MVKKPKCKFRIKVGKEYTYNCGDQEITFTNKEFEEYDDSCRFFKSSISKAKRNKASALIIASLKENIKDCEDNMNLILSKTLEESKKCLKK